MGIERRYRRVQEEVRSEAAFEHPMEWPRFHSGIFRTFCLGCLMVRPRNAA